MTRDHPLLPYAVTLAAVGLFSLMDALMKDAALAVGAFSALLLRNAFGLAVIGPVWLVTRDRWPTRRAMRIHLVRGAVASAMAFTFFWGIARIPLAEGIALSFVAPLVALYLAAILLGERIRPGAIGASLVGLAGVAVIAFGRAGGGGWSEQAAWGTGSVLVSSVLYAWNLVLLAFAPIAFELPARETWPTIAAAAVLALSAVLLLAWSYARAETQALVPLEYSGFLWAALFGWLFFAERVTLPVLLGAGLIVGACWIAAPKRPTEQTAA